MVQKRLRHSCTSVLISALPLLLQLLDVPGGSGGAQHAPPVAAGGQGSAEDHRGGGGQLPGDSGAAAHLKSAPSLPRPLDSGE